MDELFIILRKDSEQAIADVLSIGFVPIEEGDNTITYRNKKKIMALKKWRIS
jgi:hypothetical protein